MIKVNVKALREAKGLSQRALSIQSGVGQPRISQYEAEKEIPTPETCLKLATVLGCKWHDVIEVTP
ncbi:MAG: Cro/C1-type helix-turn-helix domain protein [Bacteriophage sp.]|nr:MAG: Cro/C1-type helix-turn-helix domain protein [Bacteriophage sp.]